MKLKSIYPEDDPIKYLRFINPEQSGIALMFARRLAAYVRYIGKKVNKPLLTLYIASGYRDVEKQKALYLENCRKHPPSGDGYVAKPGSSYHNGRLAIDIADMNFWKNYMLLGDMTKTAKEQELAKFGLYLPLNKKDANSVFEWWHVQPIELIGYKGDRMKFLDTDDLLLVLIPELPTLKSGDSGASVRDLQEKLIKKGYKIPADGVFGKGTENAVIAFQKVNKLQADGIVGESTWQRLK